MKNPSDFTVSERHWFSQELMTAYVFMNIALGFPPLDTDFSCEEKLAPWRAFRALLQQGKVPGAYHQRNPDGSIKPGDRYSVLPLAGLLVAEPALPPSLQCVRDCILRWRSFYENRYGELPGVKPRDRKAYVLEEYWARVRRGEMGESANADAANLADWYKGQFPEDKKGIKKETIRKAIGQIRRESSQPEAPTSD